MAPGKCSKLLMGRILAGIDNGAPGTYLRSRKYRQALKLVQQSLACLYGRMGVLMMAEKRLTVASKLKRAIACLILGSLWLVAACAPGGGYGPSSENISPPQPAYNYPDYYGGCPHSDCSPDLP
jgi:hypothetical protein